MSQIFNISAIFGDKPWFKSMTAWGLIIFFGGTAMLEQACSEGLIAAGVCAFALKATQTVGSIVGVLGLRRAAQAPNVG